MRLRFIALFLGLTVSVFAEVKVVAHRGASAYAPENSIEAIQLAWELGADAVEADFRITKDGHIVCIHDSDTERVANQKIAVETSLLSELKALELVSGNEENGVSRIPELADVLASVPAGKLAYLELKSDVRIVPEFLEVLKSSPVPAAQLIVISFNSDVLAELALRAPELKTILLVSLKRKGFVLRPSISSIIEEAEAAKVDGVSVKAHPMMPQDFGFKLKAAGYEFHVWTVDSPEWGIEMIKRGAQSITTNKPDLLKAALESYNQSSK